MKRLMHIRIIIIFITMAACQPGSNEEKDKKTADHKEQSNRQNHEKVDVADIDAGIRAHIKTKTEEDGGRFHIKNGDEELRLKLVRVHTEYISNLGPNRHFACVDLADVSGDVYDVDFFLEGKAGDMSITETTVHKLNGKPFYTWKQREDKTWHRVSVEEASNELLGVIEGKDVFEFRYEAKLPEITEQAKMWIPIANTNRFQKVKITSLNVPVQHEMLEEEENGNTIMYLEVGPEQSGKRLEIIYQVERKEKGPYKAEEASPEKYLASSELLPVGGRFKLIADEAIKGSSADNKLMQARALYDYIIDNMEYIKDGVYGTGDANYACDARSGNCTEFHSLFISLARSAGIPARFAIGASIPSSRDEGGINGYHCWAEFYAEGKWWPVDISEGNKYTALATYYFGHHPANRIELSSGRNLQVKPGPESGPIEFIAYPLLEVGGRSTAVETNFSFVRKQG